MSSLRRSTRRSRSRLLRRPSGRGSRTARPATAPSTWHCVGGLDQADRLREVRAGTGVAGGEEAVRAGDREAHQVDDRPDAHGALGLVAEQALMGREVDLAVSSVAGRLNALALVGGFALFAAISAYFGE